MRPVIRPIYLLCTLSVWLWAVCLGAPNLAISQTAAVPLAAVNKYLTNGGYLLALSHNQSWGANTKQAFIPASTIKLATSLAALEILGRDFRFETRFYLDDDNNLYIQGTGDPFLTSESIEAVATALARLGIRRINTLYLDDSLFNSDRPTDGSTTTANPYDAPNGALAVNFNALPVKVHTDGSISSGEPQTPLIPLMHEAAASLSVGQHRMNINSLNVATPLPLPLRYTGELFQAQFRQEHISVSDNIRQQQVPAHLVPLYIHHSSKTVEKIIEAMLHYSNNFIANQLFLAIGARISGFPASWDKSKAAVTSYLTQQLGLSTKSFTVVEGSGLSEKNRITPEAMLTLLEAFTPYKHLLARTHNTPLKSGTLTGVYCYAGYLQVDGHDSPFAILLNQPQNNRDEILQLLKKVKISPIDR